MENKNIDVFISRKSQDAKYAKQLYDFLKSKGLSVFESDHSLKEIGDAEYIKSIDEALVNTTHLIVLASNKEFIVSPWVEAEWIFFLNRKRSGKAKGNLLTVTKGMNMDDVPPSLQNYEIIEFHPKNYERIYAYVRKDNEQLTGGTPGKRIRIPWYLRYGFVLGSSVAILLSTFIFMYVQSLKPFMSIIQLNKDSLQSLSSKYPKFSGAVCYIRLGGEERLLQFPAEDEQNKIKEQLIQHIPSSYRNKKVAVKTTKSPKFWKLALDSIVLSENIHVPIIPDGSLSNVRFIVVDYKTGVPLSGVKAIIDNDPELQIVCGETGIGSFKVPINKQAKEYQITLIKEGYNSESFTYYPGLDDRNIVFDLKQ